jgi:hypothetical protein
MSAPVFMTKDKMSAGLALGKTLIQEEWANPAEITWVDELVAEGAANAEPWVYDDNFQCSKRRIKGVLVPVNEQT